MKHTPYIICIAILALLILVQDGFMISNNRIISTLRDSTAYWKGRYDSAANRIPALMFSDTVHIGTVEGDAIFGDKNIINH